MIDNEDQDSFLNFDSNDLQVSHNPSSWSHHSAAVPAKETHFALRGQADPRGGGVAVLSVSPPNGLMVDGAIANMEFNKTNLQKYSIYNRYESGNQPIVALVDNYGNLVTSGSYEVTARLFNNPGCTILHGNSIIWSNRGLARFTDLMIDAGSSDYRFIFSTGLLSSPIELITNNFYVALGQLYIPFDSLWNPFDSSSARQLTAGDLLMSTLNTTLQPRSGFEFPTVWLRVFNSSNTADGYEHDGWVDDFSFAQDVLVSLLVDPEYDNNFPSIYCSPLIGTLICVQGVFGIRTVTAQQVVRGGGRAVFTNLFVAMAGRHKLLFTSPGFRSFTVSELNVVPSAATTIIILQQPGSVSDAGYPLRTMPAINLVDRFNNSIQEPGWRVSVILSGAGGPYAATCSGQPTSSPCRCATRRCITYIDYAPLPITGPTAAGILQFTDLVLIQSGAAFVFTFKATWAAVENSTVDATAAVQARSIPVSVLPGPLVALALHNSPWNPTPVVGIPFVTQPILWFIDRFQNVIQAVSNVLIQCQLAGSDGSILADQSPLVGTRSALTIGGQAQYTSLAIVRPGTFTLLFSFASYEVLASGETGLGFTVNSGPLARIEFVSQPQTSASAFPIIPAVSLRFLDLLGNSINTNYSFILQIQPSQFLYQGSLVDDTTLLSCGACVKGGGIALFSPAGAAVFNFSDLAPILDSRLEYKLGAFLQVIAINSSRCITQGTYTDCTAFPGDPNKDPTIVDGRRVQGASNAFNIFQVSSLEITNQPADTSASM